MISPIYPIFFEYKDKKCKTLEIIIQKDAKFAEFVVKRIRDNSNESDPFIFMNEQEEVGVWLEEWEIDTLNDNELLAYITAQIVRNSIADRREVALFLLLLASLLALVLLSAIFLIPAIYIGLALYGVLFPMESLIITSLGIFIVIIGPIYFLQRRIRFVKERDFDFKSAKEDAMFLEALRKLATVPESDHIYNKKHRKRLEYLESALFGVGL